MDERPILKALITRVEEHARRFLVIDLLEWEAYRVDGWTWIALDPETEGNYIHDSLKVRRQPRG